MPFPVEERFITDAEAALGVRLPDAYRQKLMRENGGALVVAGDTWRLFPVRDAGDRKRLARTCNDIVLETANAKKWTGFPEDAIALGTNDSGDFLVLLADQALYRWHHETGATRLVTRDIGDVL